MAAPKPKPLIGSARPRIAPPIPARTAVADLEEEAAGIGMTLIPSQKTVGRYLYALGPEDRWLYPEVATLMSRQNGKTELLMPHVRRRLRMGRRVLHAAQTRELPRRLFNRLAIGIERDYPDAKIRRGAGQETIELKNGGLYLITAATGGGARGIDAIDDLLVDEVREIDEDFIGAALPTTIASLNPQVLYLSNAGHDTSHVLNAIRDRGESDPALAYLEWSADPKRDPGDRRGWVEANPAIGQEQFPRLMDSLERIYESSRLAGSMARFETEHLCRWVDSLREPLVKAGYWAACEAATVTEPRQPLMAISMDPAGKRASAAIAWSRPDDKIGLRLLFDVTGDPINVDRLGGDMSEMARSLNVQMVGFDPLTDAILAKYFRQTKKMSGAEFANATAQFVIAVDSKAIQWDRAAVVGDDLIWTARKQHDDSGSFQAVRADDSRPITAALAAIRAVGLASAPRPRSVYDQRGMISV